MSNLRKIALVTGASSDIGAVVVRELLAAEYEVYAQINANPKSLKGLESPHLKVIAHNLSNAAGAEQLVKKVVREAQRLDVLVNTIGPFLHKNLGEVTPQEWEEQVHFNLNLPFYMIHAAKEHLIQSEGQVINFTFAGAEMTKSWVSSTAFSAAKVGLAVLTKSMATLLAPHRVRVNAVSPGLIEGGGATDSTSEERLEMAKQVPYGRPGTPDEVAQVVLWLLKGSPAYLTGALIPISGAWEYV